MCFFFCCHFACARRDVKIKNCWSKTQSRFLLRPTARDSSACGFVSTSIPPQRKGRSADETGAIYHRRRDCCRRAGDSDSGGLGMEMPVAGLTMGMALRPRVAEGWCSLKLEGWAWKLGGIKGGEDELSEKAGATVWGCWVGEASGELLASDERSEAEMDTNCCSGESDRLREGEEEEEEEEECAGLGGLLTSLSVSRPGQNSRSSSRSKDRPASKRERKADRAAVSLSSFMLRTPRNWRCEFCDTVRRGVLRLRPPLWWLCETEATCAACALYP